MTYRDKMTSWAIARMLPTGQTVIIHRMSSRMEADARCKVLSRLMPTVRFHVIFDVPVDNTVA